MPTIVFSLYIIFTTIVKAHEKITISIELGDITGNVKNIHGPEKVYEFLGISFGIPPIGSLRFRPAQLNTSWNTSTYDATTYGPQCIQASGKYTAKVPTSEDCLYLNIWTPNLVKNNLLPVMFWIYGGGFVGGAGSQPDFDGVNMIGTGKDFVLVNANYRLGPLGYLQSQQLYDEDPKWKSYGGMNGLYDQIQALNWIKRYISGFGGDPNQITVFGESAGGISTCELLISPMVTPNTFQRAIVESGECYGPWNPMSIEQGLNFTNQQLTANKMSTDINTLRTYPASKFASFYYWTPSVDALLITQETAISFENLNNKSVVFNAQEVIIGFNSDDGITVTQPTTPEQYHQFINNVVKNQTQANLIENYYYPLSDFAPDGKQTSASIAWNTMGGDCCLACSSMYLIGLISKQKTDNFKGYVYEFRGGGPPYYAYHSSEIPFVYDHKNDAFGIPWSQNLSNAMVSSWTNFAKYGIPNSTVSGNQIVWKEYTSTDANVIIWDDNVRIEQDYFNTFRHGACAFWFEQAGYDVMAAMCTAY